MKVCFFHIGSQVSHGHAFAIVQRYWASIFIILQNSVFFQYIYLSHIYTDPNQWFFCSKIHFHMYFLHNNLLDELASRCVLKIWYQNQIFLFSLDFYTFFLFFSFLSIKIYVQTTYVKKKHGFFTNYFFFAKIPFFPKHVHGTPWILNLG